MGERSAINDINIVDKDGALERLGGDEDLYLEVVEEYLKDAPIQIKTLEEALANNDVTVSERKAHSLKSASGNIGAEQVRFIASDIEKAAHEGNLDECRELFSNLENSFVRVKEYFSR